MFRRISTAGALGWQAIAETTAGRHELHITAGARSERSSDFTTKPSPPDDWAAWTKSWSWWTVRNTTAP